MTAGELLDVLSGRGIELWLEGERLRFRAEEGVFTDELKARVTELKPEIVDLLAERRSNDSRTFPLSYGQQALWFIARHDPQNTAYHVAFTARIHSPVDLEALRWAFQALIDRHDALRSTFPAPGGQPVQVVSGHQEVAFEQVAVPGLGETELRRRVVGAYQQPFDLEKGPVYRVRLFTRSDRDHVLLIVAHHIVIDGWSQLQLLDELAELYNARAKGEPVALPRPERQYGDFVAYQRALLSGERGDALLSFWREQLSGDLPDLDLPTDRPRPAVLHYDGASLPFEIHGDVTRRVNEFARESGATPYVVLLAAFQALLGRYARQDDILVGSATYGRNRPEFADTVGYFINMVVQRGDLSGDPTFRELVERVRRTSLASLAHQEYPFPLLVEKLRARRDPSRSPLFQVGFVLHRFGRSQSMQAFQLSTDPTHRQDFGGLQLSPYPIPQMEGQFDLSLELIEWESALTGGLKYNTHLFREDFARRMIGHLQALLDQATRTPDQPLTGVSLLTDEEARLLADWNGTGAGEAPEGTFHGLFEQQADRTPEGVALVHGQRHLTYDQLERQANRLANHLRSLGVGPGAVVAICLERSIEALVAILGVLKSGGAFLPLDPGHPRDRLAFVLDDSAASMLLTSEDLRSSLPHSSIPSLTIDPGLRGLIANTERPAPIATGRDLAYVIYTSGSTGAPKGVLVEHRGLANVARAQWDAFGLGPEDQIPLFGPLAFDASISEITAALSVGATLHLASTETLMPGRPLLEFLQDRRITFTILTPSALAVVPRASLPHLHTIAVAGEPCPAELVASWAPGRRFLNLYGPTEATIWATWTRCDPDADFVPIGRPIPNTTAHVLDPAGRPLPIGVPGELYLGGVGVARGYLNRPDLTAERFVADPFSDHADARLYRTGDLATIGPQGAIRFLGRLDEQVKIRGFRVEIGEIEAALLEHEDVREAAVVPLGSGASRRLSGFVVLQGEATVTPTELTDLLHRRLPAYLIPSRIGVVARMPRTVAGKLDRKALVRAATDAASGETGGLAPQTDTERMVAGIWQDALGVEAVGARENFFELGGHSLLLAQIQIDLERELGRNIEIVDLLRYPTVETLAAHLSNAGSSKTSFEDIEARTARRDHELRKRRAQRERRRRDAR